MHDREDERLLDPMAAAHAMLGGIVRAGGVSVRIVEVEAYGGPPDGPWPDPAAHSFRGPTPRNRVMFGPPGRLYVYLSYGMHMCANIVCGPDGVGAAVLLRAGEVIDGLDVARMRRPAARHDRDLARGPGNLGSALGLSLGDNRIDTLAVGSTVALTLGGATDVATGPRVGVSQAADRAWRVWIPGSTAVSAYKRSPRAPA